MTTHGRSWIITYVANGNYLTYDILIQYGCDDVDECHYTSDSVVVYSYVHFKRPRSLTALKHFFDSIKEKLDIVLFDVFGYESVSTSANGSDMRDHIGFRILMDHYTGRNPSFRSCTDGVSGVSKGMLWKSNYSERIKDCLKRYSGDYVKHFEKMEKNLEEAKKTSETVELLQQELASAQSELAEYRHYKFVTFVLRCRICSLSEDDQSKMLAPDHLGRPLYLDDK